MINREIAKCNFTLEKLQNNFEEKKIVKFVDKFLITF